MKTVYAVSAGIYSDYRVHAVFSTRAKAQEFMATVRDDLSGYNYIEGYELDPPITDLVKRGHAVWLVHMLRDGTTERVQRLEPSLYNVTDIGHRVWKRSKAPAYRGTNTPDVLVSSVWAKTDKEALKIVNEHRTATIATGEWK